mmetsp:Transcript_41231/g.119419  ORF Transcript_41231/g.119419 Transcript_41231/m.119419 type:complete len:85 (-) Transcript_41231:502-756(-)
MVREDHPRSPVDHVGELIAEKGDEGACRAVRATGDGQVLVWSGPGRGCKDDGGTASAKVVYQVPSGMWQFMQLGLDVALSSMLA